MKVCRQCRSNKELVLYYKHKSMPDGHLNKCIECVKIRVKAHRELNLDKIRAYDRGRSKLEHRVFLNKENSKEYRVKNKEKYKAHNKVNNAVRDGRLLKPLKCEHCLETHNQIEGHHKDYSKPLDIIWLCSPCHKILHLGVGMGAYKLREALI